MVFSVSDNVVFSTSSSSLRPWVIRALEASASLREGWSNQDTRSVTLLSPRYKSDALDALLVLAGLTLKDPLEVVTACLNSWYWAAETFLWLPSSSSSSEMDLSLILSSGSKAAKEFTREASLGGLSSVVQPPGSSHRCPGSSHWCPGSSVWSHRWSLGHPGWGVIISGSRNRWLCRRPGLGIGNSHTLVHPSSSKVHMDIKSISIAWLIAVGIDGKRGLLTPVKIDESRLAEGVFLLEYQGLLGPLMQRSEGVLGRPHLPVLHL